MTVTSQHRDKLIDCERRGVVTGLLISKNIYYWDRVIHRRGLTGNRLRGTGKSNITLLSKLAAYATEGHGDFQVRGRRDLGGNGRDSKWGSRLIALHYK
jgi:hypothetical protein